MIGRPSGIKPGEHAGARPIDVAVPASQAIEPKPEKIHHARGSRPGPQCGPIADALVAASNGDCAQPWNLRQLTQRREAISGIERGFRRFWYAAADRLHNAACQTKRIASTRPIRSSASMPASARSSRVCRRRHLGRRDPGDAGGRPAVAAWTARPPTPHSGLESRPRLPNCRRMVRGPQLRWG